MEENNEIEEEEVLPVALTPNDIILKVTNELVPLALAAYFGLLTESKNEKVIKETADTVMEIARVRKTEESAGGVSFHFTGDQIQTAFGNLKGLKDVKIKQIEEREENGETE